MIDSPLRVVEERGRPVAPPVWVGRDPATLALREVVERVAPSNATVLIEGESGTGKDLVALTLHALSPRNTRRFVAINCAAIPADLLESELFGHQRGSFTGAEKQRPGLFQTADGGTLLLDEIGELPLSLQPKLLRVLEDQLIRPVGADKPLKVDVRVVAASNRPLEDLVDDKTFRADLFYRLQVVPLRIAPLRARLLDLVPLIRHYLAVANAGRQPPVLLSTEVWHALGDYDWPGNVRELVHLLARLVVLATSEVITLDDLPSRIRYHVVSDLRPAAGPIADSQGFDLRAALRTYRDQMIAEALRQTGGNKEAAARLLGLKRTTLVAMLRCDERPVSVSAAPKQRQGLRGFGAQLCAARVALGMTQQDLAVAVGVKVSTIYRWEHEEAAPAGAGRRNLYRYLAQHGFDPEALSENAPRTSGNGPRSDDQVAPVPDTRAEQEGDEICVKQQRRFWRWR